MADPSNIIVNGPVSEFLLNLGACWRCSQRLVRERKQEVYQVRVKDVQEPEPKVTKTSPCVICLGVLQDSFFGDGLDEVCRKIVESNYDCKTYSLMLSLPPSVMLREHAVWLLAVDKYPEILSDVVKSEHITSLKDVWKFITTAIIEEKVGKKFELNTSPLQVQVNVAYKNDEQECSCLVDMNPEMFKKRYKQTRVYQHGIFSRSAVQNLLSDVTAENFNKHFKLEVPNHQFAYGDVDCSHTSIHIAGRYNKFSRTLCQTPWVVDGKKLMESSIQELICQHLEPFFHIQNSKFSSSGREDVDVRTLGKGRPFAVELINPRRTQCVQKEINALQQLINDNTKDIAISDLQLVSKDQLLILKQGEEEKTKNYAAICVVLDAKPISQEELNEIHGITDLVVNQKTPLRVLHRRSLAVRPKTVHNMETEILSQLPGHFILRLKTQAGTYIKEFVHGDFNRSVPNLCTLLGRPVDIIALDVDHVELDWPPPVNYES